ncbi:metalloregulator ArsR/SmtB family transcription factor [Mollicutes bacterium LVI A0039]|nr:metalloregulator ArsR/SmtB family transcription factor [Mollicutes bacterium LVI A0039]
MKIDLFKLLSCQTRFDIMNLLIINEHICICHLEAGLGLSQANASKHMRLFRELKIVETEKCGKSVYYKLTEKFMSEHQKLIEYVSEGENYEKSFSVC